VVKAHVNVVQVFVLVITAMKAVIVVDPLVLTPVLVKVIVFHFDKQQNSKME
jgi:hypothetical protein